MTKESISKKLSELFELHKSGAITKEEYDKLKKQILSEVGIDNVESEKKQEQENTKTPDNPIRVKKRRRIWILLIIATVLIIATFLVFKPKIGSDAIDQDGNKFKTVIIGTQTWTTKNLDVSTFRNGDPIPEAKTNEEWAKSGDEQKPAWCYYENDSTNGEKYSKLYNWYAVNDPKGLAPKGWHVPTDAEWTTITTYLGGEDVAGGKLKEIGTTHWLTPNTGATNETGFTALPGGYRNYSGSFYVIDNYGNWWSSTEYSTAFAYSRFMSFDSSGVYRSYSNEQNGFSVRCLRDY
jgi:uncharacterized protein (TIGR02145 family)